MTHDDQSTRFDELLQLLGEHGFDGMAEAIEILLNEAMKLQRADALGAMPGLRQQSIDDRAHPCSGSRVEELHVVGVLPDGPAHACLLALPSHFRYEPCPRVHGPAILGAHSPL